MEKLDRLEVIKRFREKHGDKFDYSSMIYKNINSKVKIICPIHGIFEQTPKNHLKGNDCFECSKRKKSKLTSEFIEKSKSIHGNYYNYSQTEYKNYLTPVKIGCPIHGVFEQMPQYHTSGSGCKKCGVEKTRKCTSLGLDKFIEKSNKIHNNKYNYINVNYINSYTNVEIVCPKHGSFFQKPQDHIHSKAGCPVCKESKGEKIVASVLIEYNIDFERQKSFNNLIYKRLLSFDFYLPEYNICIEYDGEQHYKYILNWFSEETFYDLQFRDELKNEYCENNNIHLLRLTYKDSDDNIRNKILNFLNIKE